MRRHLALVVANLGLRDRADRIVGLALGGGVVGRQDGGDGAHDGAHLVVHLLCLGLLDNVLQRGALQRVGRRGSFVLGVAGDRDRRVLGEVLVVVRLCDAGVSLDLKMAALLAWFSRGL